MVGVNSSTRKILFGALKALKKRLRKKSIESLLENQLKSTQFQRKNVLSKLLTNGKKF